MTLGAVYRATAALLNAARLAKLSGPSAVYEADMTASGVSRPSSEASR